MPEIIRPEWNIIESKKGSVEIVCELDEALKSNNLDRVQRILKDARAIRSLVVRRGEGRSNLDLIDRSFGRLLEKKFGPGKSFFDIAEEKILDAIHELGLPEQILNELAASAFHRCDEKTFLKVTDIIFRNAEMLQKKEVFARAHHDFASWLAKNKKADAAVEENKKVLGLARETGDQVLEEKARYGLRAHKDLKPRDRMEGFKETAENLERMGVGYDALRARIELAGAMYELALRQEKKEKKHDLLDEAKQIAGECVNKSVEIAYPNAEILAREILAKIHSETGNNPKALEHNQKAQEMRKKYLY